MDTDIQSRPLFILHVDDHALFATALKQAMEKSFPGVVIEHIGNGSDALQYIEKRFEHGLPLDLLVTDISHPGINGLDLCKSLKGIQKFYGRRLPALVLTMHTDPQIVQRIEEMGFIYLPKSTSEVSLAAAVWVSMSLN